MAGRNNPCPCGSGRKYKQCYLPKDRVAQAQQIETNVEHYFYQFSPLAGDQLDLYYRVISSLVKYDIIGLPWEIGNLVAA